MYKSKRVPSVYGKMRVIENWNGIRRLYVKRTNVKTYAVSTSERLSFDSMIEVNGDYHFNTLADLHNALNV